ncbi:MAG TPA: Rieske 2Fe-2S domain-containing protein [Candidatus Binataceae bacterium]|nr:Rieske 2Fe-2S domain-containing protein [Candidatus Binataceae bacterium]
MAGFIETIALDRLPPGKAKAVRIGSRDIALFNVDGTVYALDDACPHAGVSLGSGKLRGGIVTCRGHGFRFDVTSGGCISIVGLRAASYPVKLADGKILVALK